MSEIEHVEITDELLGEIQYLNLRQFEGLSDMTVIKWMVSCDLGLVFVILGNHHPELHPIVAFHGVLQVDPFRKVVEVVEPPAGIAFSAFADQCPRDYRVQYVFEASSELHSNLP
jgi:hypothetical protein